MEWFAAHTRVTKVQWMCKSKLTRSSVVRNFSMLLLKPRNFLGKDFVNKMQQHVTELKVKVQDLNIIHYKYKVLINVTKYCN